jgi:hypothetical protein
LHRNQGKSVSPLPAVRIAMPFVGLHPILIEDPAPEKDHHAHTQRHGC